MAIWLYTADSPLYVELNATLRLEDRAVLRPELSFSSHLLFPRSIPTFSSDFLFSAIVPIVLRLP